MTTKAKSTEPADQPADAGVTTEDVAPLLGDTTAEQPADQPAAPAGPSFGMCEGTREELERTGQAIDPFTGKLLTRDDLPTTIDDVVLE